VQLHGRHNLDNGDGWIYCTPLREFVPCPHSAEQLAFLRCCRASPQVTHPTRHGSAGNESSSASATRGRSSQHVTNSLQARLRDGSEMQATAPDSIASSAVDGGERLHTVTGGQGVRHSANFYSSTASCGAHSRLQSAAGASAAAMPSPGNQAPGSRRGLPPSLLVAASTTSGAANSAARCVGQGPVRQEL
jgi:hypothetical protein